jgi:hypothetical protein
MFTDPDSWLTEIKRRLPESTAVTRDNTLEHMSKCSKLEYLSRERLEQQLVVHGLQFKPNHILSSSIDGWIGEHAIQLKYTSRAYGKTTRTSWDVHAQKYSHRVNNRVVYSPYSVDDKIDFFIVEADENHWFIIPTKELVDVGVVSSGTCKGQDRFRVALPTHKVAQTQMRGRPVDSFHHCYQNWVCLGTHTELSAKPPSSMSS